MLNNVCLMGRLTRDPELKYTNSNIPATSFTLAVNRAYSKDKEKQTDFINIVAWRQTAEFVAKYFSRGMLVAVQGSIQVRSYTDKNDNKRTAVEVVADSVHFAEKKKDPSVAAQGEPFVQASDFEDAGDDDGDLPWD